MKFIQGPTVDPFTSALINLTNKTASINLTTYMFMYYSYTPGRNCGYSVSNQNIRNKNKIKLYYSWNWPKLKNLKPSFSF